MKVLSLAPVAFSVAMLLAAPVAAEEVHFGNNYGRLSGGILVMEDADIDGDTLSFKTGWTVSGVIGTHLSEQFAVEAEVSYLSVDIDKLNMGGAVMPVDGSIESILTMLNAYFRPMQGNDFSPYIGAGAGAAFITYRIDNIGGIQINGKDRSSEPVFQGMAGFDVDLNAGQKIGLKYRYLHIVDGADEGEKLGGHAFELQYSLPF